MTWLAPTLWHLLGLARDKPPVPDRPRAPDKAPVRQGRTRPMQERYDSLVSDMKRTYGVRVRKWRRSTSGCAWMVRYDDGQVSRLIEAPYPRGPVSCAVFLHEVGHHAIGWDTHRLRCVEEYAAWVWALETMRARGFSVTAAVERRVTESLRYAVRKARRRGLKSVPPELLKYA